MTAEDISIYVLYNFLQGLCVLIYIPDPTAGEFS